MDAVNLKESIKFALCIASVSGVELMLMAAALAGLTHFGRKKHHSRGVWWELASRDHDICINP